MADPILPVGAIYFSSVNINPAALLGGVWLAIGSGPAFGLVVGVDVFIWKRIS